MKAKEAWQITDMVQLFKIDADTLFIEFSAYEQLKEQAEKLAEALNKYKNIVARMTPEGDDWAAKEALAEYERFKEGK